MTALDSPDDDAGPKTRAKLSVAPADFSPVVGTVAKAWFGPPYEKVVSSVKRKPSSAQKAGLGYEKKALRLLAAYFQQKSLPFEQLAWIGFKDDKGSRLCQPDMFVRLQDEKILLIEVKARHCALAWWQLRKLYEPVMRALAPASQVIVSEVVKSFSHDVEVPEKVIPFFSVLKWFTWVRENGQGFAVLQLKL